MKRELIFPLAALFLFTGTLHAQIVERPRPVKWNELIPGGRFMDRFLPMPAGKLDGHVWGAPCVVPRYADNGLEDAEYSYWGGNIIREKDGKYHMFVCGWPENSPKGHFQWPHSTVFHAVSENSIGPFSVVDTIGAGHNPEVFRLNDGRYVIYVIGGYYIAASPDGPWQRGEFTFDDRGRGIIEGLSNLTFSRREDGSYLMVCRGGGVWISRTGLSPYKQITDRRIYPDVAGNFEDPVVWRDHVQYHVIVNDWLGRIAYYLRSPDGIHWVTDPGEAYMPGIAVHEDGRKEDWFKYERIKIWQDEYGRAIQANFAVIDVLKAEDKSGDNHSSKNIGIPLNPGLLLQILNKEKITSGTKEVHVKICAEKGFDPHTDVDVSSLRFGSSSEVNFGGGWKATGTEKEGKDLVVVFQTEGKGLDDAEFAPKLLGRDSFGKMLYGYARLPWREYEVPLLSANLPVFSSKDGKTDMLVEVENFGLKQSSGAELRLSCKQGDSYEMISKGSIGRLDPYAKSSILMKIDGQFEKGRRYELRLTLASREEEESVFDFTSIPCREESHH